MLIATFWQGLLLVLMAYTCVCGSGHKNRKALALHGRFCRLSKQEATAAIQARRAAVIKVNEHRKEQKHRREEIEAAEVEERARREAEDEQRRAAAEVYFAETYDTGRRESGLPRRPTRLPARFRDDMPRPIIEIRNPQPANATPAVERDATPKPSSPHPREVFETEPDMFGTWRVYPSRPSYIPDIAQSINETCDFPTAPDPEDAPTKRSWFSSFASSLTGAWFAPFMNASIFRIFKWQYTGSRLKSLGELQRLVDDVILQEDFSVDHFKGFNAQREAKRLDDRTVQRNADGTVTRVLQQPDGWVETSVKVRVPCEGKGFQSEKHAPVFEVPGLSYRNPLEVMKAALVEPAAAHMHLTPFRLYWRSAPNSAPERLYSEQYNSDRMLRAHEELQANPPPAPPGTTLPENVENVVLGCAFFSDSTHLADFGAASLWPIYWVFVNVSKYKRLKLSSFSMHHVAYIPKLTDKFQDWFIAMFSVAATAFILTLVKRDLMHAIWLLLLSKEFIQAYQYGILITFADGITRRVFPRFIFYSADYPERILLACIKYLGAFPCAVCLTIKAAISQMGTKLDMKNRVRLQRRDDRVRRGKIETVRAWIFEKGKNLKSVFVKRIIDSSSAAPTRNAFSHRLADLGFDFYSLFVPDILHDFEIGVWKAVFTHLIRVLVAVGQDAVQTLNKRYRLVPSFGRDTIRKIKTNAAEMKKLAGRDFEDLLQCAIPVFEGLLPEPYNSIVLTLLFTYAEWHAYAKLRLHSETTIQRFKTSTERLGQVTRLFKRKVEAEYRIHDLPRELAARGRRAAAKANNGNGDTVKLKKKRRYLNLNTSKYHALGHFPLAIEEVGTLESVSTQPGEMEHRRVKNMYKMVNKSKVVDGISKLERRERRINNMKESERLKQKEDADSPSLGFLDSEPLPFTSPEKHYHTATSQRNAIDLLKWVGNHATDPAFKDFIPNLKRHLLARIHGAHHDAEFTPEDLATITIVNNKIYKHKVLRVNYTTYDMRREQDSINPRTHPFLMTLGTDDHHPFWYAQAISVFHLHARYTPPGARMPVTSQFDVVWVRWLESDDGNRTGWRAKRLHRVAYIPYDDEVQNAFGFVDPDAVIRAVHLIPAFHYGRTTALLPPSKVRRKSDNNEDWAGFYVSMFVDRDMFMRFRGGGVGHSSTREATDYFLDDLDDLDKPKAPAGADEDIEMNEAAEASNAGDTAEPEPRADDRAFSDDEMHTGAGPGSALDEDDEEDDDNDDDDDDEADEEALREEEEDYGYGGLESGVEDEDDDDEPALRDNDEDDDIDPEDGEGADAGDFTGVDDTGV